MTVLVTLVASVVRAIATAIALSGSVAATHAFSFSGAVHGSSFVVANPVTILVGKVFTLTRLPSDFIIIANPVFIGIYEFGAGRRGC